MNWQTLFPIGGIVLFVVALMRGCGSRSAGCCGGRGGGQASPGSAREGEKTGMEH